MLKSRKLGSLLGLSVLALGYGGFVLGQQDGAASKAGSRLDEAGREIKQGFQNAGDSIREGFAKTKQAVHGMGVESRVYGRLHWDKSLATSVIDVEVQTGVVTLRGTVPDAASKAKAATLAADTVGVTQVVDQLAVLTDSKTIKAPAPKSE